MKKDELDADFKAEVKNLPSCTSIRGSKDRACKSKTKYHFDDMSDSDLKPKRENRPRLQTRGSVKRKHREDVYRSRITNTLFRTALNLQKTQDSCPTDVLVVVKDVISGRVVSCGTGELQTKYLAGEKLADEKSIENAAHYVNRKGQLIRVTNTKSGKSYIKLSACLPSISPDSKVLSYLSKIKTVDADG